MGRSARRRLAVGALGLAGILAVAGCSASTEGSDGDKTLVVWTYYTAGGQLDALEQQNALWAKSHPDVKIEHVQIPFDQLPSKLLATASTRDGPDVVLDNVVVDFPSLAAAGVLADLTDYWKGYDDKDDFGGASTWKYSDDRIYNVMSYTNLLGLYYNKDALKKAGVTPPKTVADLEKAMAAVAADGTSTPMAMSGVATVEGAWMFMPLINDEGGGYCSFEGPTVTNAFDRLGHWADSKYLPKETATWDQADAWQEFMSGKYAFGINGNWNLGDVPKANFPIGTTQYPAGSKGSHVFPGGEGIGIGAHSKQKDLAWEYITSAWMSPEASLINFKASGQIPTRASLADSPKSRVMRLCSRSLPPRPTRPSGPGTSRRPLSRPRSARPAAV